MTYFTDQGFVCLLVGSFLIIVMIVVIIIIVVMIAIAVLVIIVIFVVKIITYSFPILALTLRGRHAFISVR